MAQSFFTKVLSHGKVHFEEVLNASRTSSSSHRDIQRADWFGASSDAAAVPERCRGEGRGNKARRRSVSFIRRSTPEPSLAIRVVGQRKKEIIPPQAGGPQPHRLRAAQEEHRGELLHLCHKRRILRGFRPVTASFGGWSGQGVGDLEVNPGHTEEIIPLIRSCGEGHVDRHPSPAASFIWMEEEKPRLVGIPVA